MIDIKRETSEATPLKPVTFTFTVSSLEDFKALYMVFNSAFMSIDGDEEEEFRRAESIAQALLDSVCEEAAEQWIPL